MFKKNAVRYLAVWVTILVGLGLIDYAHLQSSHSNTRATQAGVAQAPSGLPTTSQSTITRVTTPTSVQPRSRSPDTGCVRWSP